MRKQRAFHLFLSGCFGQSPEHRDKHTEQSTWALEIMTTQRPALHCGKQTEILVITQTTHSDPRSSQTLRMLAFLSRRPRAAATGRLLYESAAPQSCGSDIILDIRGSTGQGPEDGLGQIPSEELPIPSISAHSHPDTLLTQIHF